jgi:hypothetical protein
MFGSTNAETACLVVDFGVLPLSQSLVNSMLNEVRTSASMIAASVSSSKTKDSPTYGSVYHRLL